MFDPSAYQISATAMLYAATAAFVFVTGLAIALYERFGKESQRFLLLAVVVGSWLTLLGLSRMAVDTLLAERLYRWSVGLMALSGPAVYGLAIEMTGSRRRRLARWAWVAGLAVFAWSLVTPHLWRGLAAVAAGDLLSDAGLMGLALILFITALVFGAIAEFLAAYRAADSAFDRRRHLLMMAAFAVGAVAIADFFNDPPLLGTIGLAPLIVATTLVILAVGQLRYRSFAPDAGFGAEELLRAMADAILVCDEAGVIRKANRQARELAGAGAGAELVGKRVSELLTDDLRGKWSSDAVREPPGLVPGPVRDREVWLLTPGGQAIPVRVSVEPIRRAGAMAGSVIVARDLRDTVRQESELQASEVRYGVLFWHNPAIAYEFDAGGTLRNLNPAAARLFEARPGEMTGRSLAEIMAPEAMEEATAVLQRALAGEAQEYELDVVTGPDERRTLRGVSVPVFEGDRVTRVFGVALDVTDEARAKREAEVQRRYFAELFEGSPEAIALLDEQGVVRRVNSEFTRLFGYSRGEAVGRVLDDLIVPEDQRDHAAELGELANRRLLRAELVRHRKEGGLVEVSLLARRIVMPGEDVQVYAIYRDVGHQRRTEQKLREREEELRHAHKLEAVGKLAGGVAHDFNNLLTVINGHARFILDDMAPDQPHRRDLEEIEEAGVRAASLTQQLLAFSRRQVLRPQAVDLNAVVRDTERMLRRLIGTHIRLEAVLEPKLPPILADRGQIEQVLMNLIVNGRDAMPGGGTLTIRTDSVGLRPDDPRLEQWTVKPGAYVQLRVEDTGMGMTPDVLDRVFDPFFTTKERGKGTGLGLATVFGIVKQSGGHVVAETERGVGTRFTLYLPVAGADGGPEAPAEPSPPAAHPEPHLTPGATILVVEDEASVRKLASRVLERQGYTVMEAVDGAEALELARANPDSIDLVLSDLVMPRMGGRDLARAIREIRPGIAIVLMSGYDEELASGNLEADDFLPKPFTPAALIECVAGALGARTG